MRAIMNVTPSDPNATAVSVICGVIDLDTFNTPHSASTWRTRPCRSRAACPRQCQAHRPSGSDRTSRPAVSASLPDSTLELFKSVNFSFSNLDQRSVTDATPVDINQRQLRRFAPR